MAGHPELLDWLAADFVESGWNVKAIQKLIVTSATYRQASRVTPELLQRKIPKTGCLPEDRGCACGPEVIRDRAFGGIRACWSKSSGALRQALSAGRPVAGAGRRRLARCRKRARPLSPQSRTPIGSVPSPRRS